MRCYSHDEVVVTYLDPPINFTVELNPEANDEAFDIICQDCNNDTGYTENDINGDNLVDNSDIHNTNSNSFEDCGNNDEYDNNEGSEEYENYVKSNKL